MGEISIFRKREIAKAIISQLDNANSKWTSKDDTIIDAFCLFLDTVSGEIPPRNLPTTSTETIQELDRIVNKFYKNAPDYYKPRSAYSQTDIELTENEISQMRADFSSLLFSLARNHFKKLSLKKAVATSKKEQAEAEAYSKIFKEQTGKQNSPSFADSYARKMYKGDPEYLKIIKSADEDEQEYWEAIRIFEQAKEVLNAMAPKRNQ